MYIPKHFKITDNETLYQFIQDNNFGQIISLSNSQFCCTHIPFLLTANKDKLLGHMALANHQHQDMDKQEVLIIFTGPHDYISPSWYQGNGVPTWNYQALHVYGQCTTFNDAEKLKSVVDNLSNQHETQFNKPWKPDYQAKMLSAIVGVEIQISKIECQFKLSQNKSIKDQQNVVRQLRMNHSSELAQAMEHSLSKLNK